MSLESRVNSLVLSTLNDLEAKRRNRMRLLAVLIGIGITIVMWIVHLNYPHLFFLLLSSRREIKFLAALVMVPPFATAFSLGYLIYPQANEPVGNESGPMAGYFYRRSADRKWWIVIVAGIVAALNFLLMLITSEEL